MFSDTVLSNNNIRIFYTCNNILFKCNIIRMKGGTFMNKEIRDKLIKCTCDILAIIVSG